MNELSSKMNANSAIIKPTSDSMAIHITIVIKNSTKFPIQDRGNFHKTKKIIGISLGMVFIFYLFSVLSELSTSVEFIKYFSIYTLADTRNVISDVAINPINIIVSLLITLLFIGGTYIRYNKKELI